MTLYADAVEKVSSQKHLLFEAEPAEELWVWALVGGKANTYERSWSHLAATDVVKAGIYRQLIGVEEDGVALGETDSIDSVEANAGYYFHDEPAQKIYVHTTGSVDPDTLDLIAGIFRLHFSTTGRTFVKDVGVDARDFDGIADFYGKPAGLAGVHNGAWFSLSFWFRLDGGDGNLMYFFDGLTPFQNFTVTRNADNKIAIIFISEFNQPGQIRTLGTYTASPEWRHIFVSIRTNRNLETANMYVDGVLDIDTSWTVITPDASIRFVHNRWDLAAYNNGFCCFLDGRVSGFWFHPNNYLTAAERFKFRNIDGEPVELGDNGELPNGIIPAVYSPDGDLSNNLGNGGAFTPAGSPTRAAGPMIRERHIYYEKRVLVNSTANVAESAVDLIIGRHRTTQGRISLANMDGLFDKPSRAWNWKNKRARYRFGVDDVPLSEYQTTGRLIVDDIEPLEESFSLQLVSSGDAWRQRFPPTPHFGAGLGEGVEGTRVPVLLGRKNDIVPDLVDNELTNPNEWVYRIADNANQTLYGVLQVVAIERSTRVLTILTLAVDYTVDLPNCAITVNDAFDPGAEIEDKYEILASAQGQPVAAGDTSTDFLKLPGELAHYVLNTFLGYSDAELDLDSFAAADVNAPYILGFWVKQETDVREVLRGIERSVLGAIRLRDDGIVEFFVWDPWSGSADAIELGDEDFSRFRPDIKMASVYYETTVKYNEDLRHPGSFEIETATDDKTRYLNDSVQKLSVETYLKSASDAQLIAQRINFLYRGINVEIDFAERGIRMMDHNLYQRVRVTKTRAPSTEGSYDSRLMELLVIEKDLVTPRVSGRLGDLRGLVEVIGVWTEADAPAWGAATDEEKAASGFWTDANGLVDPTDPASKNKSLWWSALPFVLLFSLGYGSPSFYPNADSTPAMTVPLVGILCAIFVSLWTMSARTAVASFFDRVLHIFDKRAKK